MGFIFIFPILEVSVFFTAIGGDPKGLQLAVVNDELAAWNITNCAQFNALYGKPGVYEVFEGGGNFTDGSGIGNETLDQPICTYRLLSCVFLEYLDHDMSKQVHYKHSYYDRWSVARSHRQGFSV